jgi:hypothetical protein
VTRVGENDYYFTTSSARADASEEWFRYHSRYEDWDFGMVNLTDHLAAINLAGPNSRKIPPCVRVVVTCSPSDHRRVSPPPWGRAHPAVAPNFLTGGAGG